MKQAQNNVTRTIKQGTNGSGQTIWVVFTVKTLDNGAERVLGTERFNTLEEAQCWVRWA